MIDSVEKGSDFIRDLGDAARRNPISAALLGMGVLWLFAAKSGVRPSDVLEKTGLNRLPEAARNTMNMAQDRVASVADAVRESGGDGIETASRMASEYAGQYGKMLSRSPDMLGDVRDNLTELFKAQPLALGAIGLAIGAGIAAALPNTETENAYLGASSETFKNKAAEFAGAQIEAASTLAKEVVEAATEESRKQGLTVEDAKTAMGDLSGKIGRVAEAARKNASETVR